VQHTLRLTPMLLVSALAVTLAFAQSDRAATTVLDVAEAAVRWGLTSPEVAAASTVYLEVDQGAPSDALLTRLGDVRKLVSVAKCPQTEFYGRLGCRPPKGSLVLNVWEVAIVGPTSAKAHVGHYDGPTSGMACEEFFTLVESGWRRRPARPNESPVCGVS
jgi:hypothetical protein